MILITPCFLFDGEMNVLFCLFFFQNQNCDKHPILVTDFRAHLTLKNAVNENNISTYIEIKDIYFFTFYQKKELHF